MRSAAVILALAAAAAWLLLRDDSRDTLPLTVRLVNGGTVPVTEIGYATAEGRIYTPVALADGPLEPESSVELTIPGGRAQCAYNLRFATTDEAVAWRPDVDFCAASEYRFGSE